MIQLVYMSAASTAFSQNDLKLLLARSRRRNTAHDLTGMLLYHSGSFLQVLEGPEDAVHRIFTTIERDPRHSHVHIIDRVALRSREFKDWSMAFIDTSLWPDTPGLVDYDKILPQLASAPTAAERYVRRFLEGSYRQAIFA